MNLNSCVNIVNDLLTNMAKKKLKKVGRPTLYWKKYPEQAYKQCLAGATDADLANFFEVDEDTINVWKKKS